MYRSKKLADIFIFLFETKFKKINSGTLTSETKKKEELKELTEELIKVSIVIDQYDFCFGKLENEYKDLI